MSNVTAQSPDIADRIKGKAALKCPHCDGTGVMSRPFMPALGLSAITVCSCVKMEPVE
ncbi:hypothetical protein [Halovulum sp. GXIMD14793]